MSLAVVYSRVGNNINAPLVTVEVHLSNGLPSLSIVGLAETAVKESKDRVRGALLNSQFDFPTRRITINLAPADLPKDGGRFDLPIAIGILAASGQISADALEEYEFIGELALSGALRHVRGVLPVAMQSTFANRTLILPATNAEEANLIDNAKVLGAEHLLNICAHLNKQKQLLPTKEEPQKSIKIQVTDTDMAQVRGQQHAKRALEIAAAGGHSLLLIGPPGAGKTMLASRLPSILPPMTEAEAMESAAVLSISTDGFNAEQWRQRPFRSPHHSASAAALVGGGSHPKPGEISLAHCGVLFLDEFPEFSRKALEVMREPLESGRVSISRANRKTEFPALFQLIAAMNPCPCGHLGDAQGRCHCTSEQVQRYRGRISGPILDRIDMHIEVPAVPHSLLTPGTHHDAKTSKEIQQRVIAARLRQQQRANKPNHQLNPQELEQYCQLNPQGQQLVEQALYKLGLSARAYHRILRLSRTIADLANDQAIQSQHLAEAINYRLLDRQSN